MRFRYFLVLLLLAGILCSLEWTRAEPVHRRDGEFGLFKKKRKRRKQPKQPKKKKAVSVNDSRKTNPQDTAKARKEKAKRDKVHDRHIAKIQSERDKKNAKMAKEDKKGHTTYDKCDSADVVRTSKDTLILAKYIRIYRTLGGVCYIIHLQEMARLEKTSDGFYTVAMKPSKDPRAPADWQTYLYCPIGKPDGLVALTSPEGDTVQVCSYKGERKVGLMSWFKKGQGIIHQERFVNDEKVWVSDEQQ